MEFSDILQDLGRSRAPIAEGGYGRRASGDDFWHLLDGFSRTAGVDGEASRAAYRANEGIARQAVPKPAPVPETQPSLEPPSLDPADIAFELGLDAATSLDDLKTVRRLFARSNHPDRMPPAERLRANQRMTLANALIDAAATRFSR